MQTDCYCLPVSSTIKLLFTCICIHICNRDWKSDQQKKCHLDARINAIHIFLYFYVKTHNSISTLTNIYHYYLYLVLVLNGPKTDLRTDAVYMQTDTHTCAHKHTHPIYIYINKETSMNVLDYCMCQGWLVGWLIRVIVMHTRHVGYQHRKDLHVLRKASHKIFTVLKY